MTGLIVAGLGFSGIIALIVYAAADSRKRIRRMAQEIRTRGRS